MGCYGNEKMRNDADHSYPHGTLVRPLIKRSYIGPGCDGQDVACSVQLRMLRDVEAEGRFGGILQLVGSLSYCLACKI
jgi:hypothetical protein